MTARLALRALILVGASIALVATAASQHPNFAFDRLRRFDRIGVLMPNWRFFAPEPAMHDFHILHRTLDRAGVTSPWEDTFLFAPRRLSQALWFPGRRGEKAVFDAVSELLQALDFDTDVATSPAHRGIASQVRGAIADRAVPGPENISGFQFLIARHAGIERGAEPEYIFASAFIPMENQ